MKGKKFNLKGLMVNYYHFLLVNVGYINETLKKNFALPLIKNASHLILGTGIQSVLIFLFWIIAVRLFDPSTIGLSSALFSVLGLFAIIAELGFGIGLIRFLPGSGDDENSLINTCFTISGLFSILLAIVFIIGLPVWGTSFVSLFSSPVFSLIFIAFAIVFTLLPLLTNIFLGKRSTKFIVYITSITGVSRIAFLFLIIFISHNVFGLFFILGLATFLGFFIGIYVYLPHVSPSYRLLPMIHVRILQNIRNYSAVNYISRLLLQITPLILPLMIVNVLSSQMNAYFVMSWTLVVVAQVIPTSLCNSFLAESVNEKKLNRNNFKKVLSLMLEILVPVTILLIIFPNVILSIFGSTYADQGTPLVRILSLSLIPWGIIYLFITVERYKKSSLGIIYATLASAVLSIGFSYIFMVNWGLPGLCIGYLTGQVIIAFIVGILLWRMMKREQVQRSDENAFIVP